MSGHSPLGFSGAERYFACPGSVALLAALPPSEEADPEYTRAGTAAHAAAAWCLREGTDAWEAAGQDWEGYTLAAEDLAAVQFYLDIDRADPPDFILDGIEREFRAPVIHELAYGTIDRFKIYRETGALTVLITDYKHGAGMFVGAEWNKQMMGYGALLAHVYPAVKRFRLRIVQPRCDVETKVREWEIHHTVLEHWVETELKPTMKRADPKERIVSWLKAGPHCRFCRVQKMLACPEHNQIAKVVEQAPAVEQLSDERLGELYAKVEPLRMMIRSIEAEALRRVLNGSPVPGAKAVKKIANRAWKDTAKVALTGQLGPCVMTEPALKSPAEIEKMGKAAKQLVKEYAFTPDAGLTVAPLSDRRAAITVQSPAQNFAKYIDTQEKIS